MFKIRGSSAIHTLMLLWQQLIILWLCEVGQMQRYLEKERVNEIAMNGGGLVLSC